MKFIVYRTSQGMDSPEPPCPGAMLSERKVEESTRPPASPPGKWPDDPRYREWLANGSDHCEANQYLCRLMPVPCWTVELDGLDAVLEFMRQIDLLLEHGTVSMPLPDRYNEMPFIEIDDD